MKVESPALLWPPLLELPPASTLVVYLDLNQWIYLAQAAVGHERGRPLIGVLDACRAARAAGIAAFVLSQSHYIEMLKIKSEEQRRALADVMEELTDFGTIISRVVVMKLELSAALDRFGIRQPALPVTPLLGRGVRHAAGRESGLRIMSPSGDVTAEFRGQIGTERFDAIVAEANLQLERGVLRGPTDGEVADLRDLGWNPERVIAVAENRAAQERQLTSSLDTEPRWRRGRLRDVVSARELIIEFENMLPEALREHGLRLSQVMTDPKTARAFVGSMPSTAVSVELKTAWHRNRDKKWGANDIHDIDALSLAVPYCDIVVTEKACHHALKAAHLDSRMGTALLRNLRDLPETLRDWKPQRPASLAE